MNWNTKEFLFKRIYDFQKEYPNFPFVDIGMFCYENGWKLEFYGNTPYANAFLSASNDGFTILNKGQYSIYINENQPSTRKNFTMCHEIAHIELDHHSLGNEMLLMSGRSGTLETQANIFASNILFPCDLALRLQHWNKREIANFLDYSFEMVTFRYKNLKRDLRMLKYIENKYR